MYIGVGLPIAAIRSAPGFGGAISNATVGQTVYAVLPITGAGNPPGAPNHLPTYQWQRNGANIPGATGVSYVVQAADIGAGSLSVTGRGTANEVITIPAISVQAVPVVPVAPANTVAPSISGTAQEGQTLTAARGTWTGTAPITYAYQWQRGGDDIAGATASSYTAVFDDVGTTLRVAVTASNAAGSVSANSAATAVVSGAVVAGGVLTITDLSRDKVVYDTGAAFGRANTDVPLRGTGTPGRVVQARAVAQGSGGQPTTGWVDVATIGAGGEWSGALPAVPLSTTYWIAEARLKNETGVTAAHSNRFATGHRIIHFGQSEDAMGYNSFHSQTPVPTIVDEDALTVFWYVQTFGEVQPPNVLPAQRITNATPMTASMAAFSNVLAAMRPGEKVALIGHTLSGTSFMSMVNDSSQGRDWLWDKALADYANMDGDTGGVLTSSWYAAPSQLGSAYGETWAAILTKKQANGSEVTIPGTITARSYNNSLVTTDADHWIGELYDIDGGKYRFVPQGAHAFIPSEDLLNATTFADGTSQFNLVNKGRASTSMRETIANPVYGNFFTALMMNKNAHSTGFANGSGGWIDGAHPTAANEDGLVKATVMTMHGALRGMGLTNWPATEFDNCAWEPSGAYVEVWSSAGPITTTRIKRGEPALPKTYPHWTEVFGWQINGMPAQRAEIVSGRVRIYPIPPATAFTATDTINYGEGGASGQIKFPEDVLSESWKNIPIVDHGLAGLDGVPLLHLPSAAVLANTLNASGGAATFTTTASGPNFVEPTAFSSGVSGMHIKIVGVLNPTEITNFLAGISGAQLGLKYLSHTGGLNYNLADSSGLLFSTTFVGAGTITAGSPVEIVLDFDLIARTFNIWVDGNVVANETIPANSGVMGSIKTLSLLGTNTGTQLTPGTFSEVAVWLSSSGAIADPVAAPYKRLVGPAALVNADPWRFGSVDAT